MATTESLRRARRTPRQLDDDDSDDSPDLRPAHRRVGTYLLGIIVIGFAASVLVFTMTMQGMGWPPAVMGGVKANMPGAQGDASVMLYASPQNRRYYADAGGNYDTLLGPWRKYLADTRTKARELTQLAEISGLATGTLVLPSAAVLTSDERRAILAFRDRGGGVLATWATGTRGPGGEWMGWDFLEQLGGAKYLGDLPKSAEAGNLILNGESPVAFSQGAGKRIWLGSNAEPALRLKGPGVAARFMNWTRTPDRSRADEGAVIYAQAGPKAGRTVIFGFAESSWEYQQADIHTLVSDSLSWLTHRPSLVKAAWPYGKKSAQLVEMDTEEGFANARALAGMMRAIDYRGAFYVLTSSAIAFPDVLQELHRDFEVAYHGDIHTSFKGQPRDTQQQRITAMVSQLQTVIPQTGAVKGFRAPTEGYDKTTDILLLKAGLRHHLAGPGEANLRLPFFAPIEGTDILNGLLILPRTQRDDLNLLATFTDAPQLTQALIDDLNLARDNGALGVLSVHSQNFGEAQPLHLAMPAYLAYLRSQRESIWLAAPSEIDAWWRDRERLRLAVRPVGPRLELDLSVGGKQPVKGASLILMLPRKGVLPSVNGLKLGMPVPKVSLLDDFRATVVFDALEPGDYFYRITF